MDEKKDFTAKDEEEFFYPFSAPGFFGGVTQSTIDSENLHDYIPGPEVGFRYSAKLYPWEDIIHG